VIVTRGDYRPRLMVKFLKMLKHEIESGYEPPIPIDFTIEKDGW